MEKSTTFRASFELSLLPPGKKILRPIILFRVNTIDSENPYDLYSRTCADESSMLEVVDFTVSYAPVAIIKSLRIIV